MYTIKNNKIKKLTSLKKIVWWCPLKLSLENAEKILIKRITLYNLCEWN